MTLDKPVNYFAYALARPVKAVDGPQLRVGDLTKRFREQLRRRRRRARHAALPEPGLRSSSRSGRHRLSGTLSIPTRREHGVTRAISLRFRAPHFDLAHPIRTVRVVPPHASRPLARVAPAASMPATVVG